MHTHEVDVAIIGAGTAGLNARREAERAGKRWILIEGGPYGTTCARVGCMPSKLLIAAADTAHEIAHASRFGVQVDEGSWRVDGAAVMARVRRERDRFAGFVVRDTEALPEQQRLRGWARFIAPLTLEVTSAGQAPAQVKAQAIVIATGSEPIFPPPFAPLRDALMDNEQLFDLTELPASMAVIGAGIIGLELGQAMHRLGVRTTIFDVATHPGALSDPKLRELATSLFTQELDLELGYRLQTIERTAQGQLRMVWERASGQTREATFERVLVAAGRRPRLRGLDLEAAGLTLDARGMPAIDPFTMQAQDSPIFIAGDANGQLPLLHEASDEGRIAGYNAAHWPEVSSGIRRTPMAVAFTSPQMASVGLRHDQLNPDEIVTGEVSYANQGRARVMGQNSGMVRLYARKRDCVLVGAELLGPRMEHMAHLLAWAIQSNQSVPQLLGMPFYHPVFEEGLRTALRDAAQTLKLVGQCPPQHFAMSPGQ